MMVLIDTFREAEEFVTRKYNTELATVYAFLEKNPDHIGKTEFLTQYVHVVYCSGFKYSVVVKNWIRIAEAWCNFNCTEIANNLDLCKEKASKIINHKGKIKAIAETSVWLDKITNTYLNRFIMDGQKRIDTFKQLGYIGDITKYHLGLCMGFDVIKPDVHVQRIADYYNLDPFKMCETLSDETGYPKRVVDAILWRAAEQGAISINKQSKRMSE